MNTPNASDDGEFERWLEDRLDTHLGVHADRPAPHEARYATTRRRLAMTPLRFGMAAAAAVVAIGGGAAYASGLVHGTTVSNAANSCPTSPADAHGDCVATAAHSTTTGSTTTSGTTTHSDNDNHGDQVSNAAHTCPTSPPGAHGQCVSAIASGGRSTVHTSTTTGSGAAGDTHGDSVSSAAQAAGSSHH